MIDRDKTGGWPETPRQPDFGDDIAKTQVGENPPTKDSRPPAKEGSDE
jgi:hypothetical protein